MNRPRYHPRSYPFRFARPDSIESGQGDEFVDSRTIDMPFFAQRSGRSDQGPKSFLERLFHICLQAFLGMVAFALFVLAILNYRITLFGDGCVTFDRKPTWTFDDTFRYGGNTPPAGRNVALFPLAERSTASSERTRTEAGNSGQSIVPRLVNRVPCEPGRSIGCTAGVAIIPSNHPPVEGDPVGEIVQAHLNRAPVSEPVSSNAPRGVYVEISAPVPITRRDPAGEAAQPTTESKVSPIARVEDIVSGRAVPREYAMASRRNAVEPERISEGQDQVECRRIRSKIERAVAQHETACSGRKMNKLRLFALIERGYLDDLLACPNGGNWTLSHNAGAPVVRCSVHRIP